MGEVLEASKLLLIGGNFPCIECRVLSFLTVKPIDTDAIRKATSETKAIITVEEHNLSGGFGSAIAEAITDMGLSVKLVRIGIKDCFSTEVGSQQYLREINGLTAEHIAKAVREALSYVGKSRVS